MTTNQIEEVFCKKTDSLADPECEHCEGIGTLVDALGIEHECYCIAEYRRELHADDFQQD